MRYGVSITRQSLRWVTIGPAIPLLSVIPIVDSF